MTQGETIQLAIEHIKELVLLFCEDGQISYANMAAKDMLEYGVRITEYHAKDIFPAIFSESELFQEAVLKYLEKTTKLEAYRLNRTCFRANVSFRKVTDDIYECIASDESEELYLQQKLKQAEQETQNASRVKSEFVANITHELRTPVNGILGNILELKDMEDNPSKKRILTLVERGCADMNAIINNILDFSKLEAGKFTIEKREFDFREMMAYVESNHRPKASGKGLDFTISIAPDIPKKVIGDELRIVQVLNNLLSNACKFTNVGGISVEVVKTARAAGRIELFFLVIDTGIGINKENQKKLFQSFSQADASISRRFGGTGLGLNITKQLVELMNGSIHVESNEGKGSMFSFHIWLDLPEDDAQKNDLMAEPVSTSYRLNLAEFFENEEVEVIRTYGTEENIAEIKRNLNKLVLSVEMENWEKAETFANNIRVLTENAPKEVRNKILRAKMSVQKEDYDKTAKAVGDIRELLKI